MRVDPTFGTLVRLNARIIICTLTSLHIESLFFVKQEYVYNIQIMKVNSLYVLCIPLNTSNVRCGSSLDVQISPHTNIYAFEVKSIQN